MYRICTGKNGVTTSLPCNVLQINMLDGAGRGNRTPMELLPTDFEFPENTVSL